MKKKSLFTFFIGLLFSISFTSVSCKNESNQTLDPSMFTHSEDASDSSEDTEIQEINISGKLMNIDSVSEGIIVHLTYSKTYYPYFKLFITYEDTNKEIIVTHNKSEGENDIVFVPVTQNNTYSVTLCIYTSEENFIINKVDDFDRIPSIKAVGGSGEYTFTTSSTNPKADYNESTKFLTFNTITSSNQSYESRQTFDLYIYKLTPMAPVNGQTDLTELTILEKFPNRKVLTASDNTYNVSQVLQEYCEENNLDSVQFGLLEKMQFRKAGESNYLYEVIYYDTVFSHHDPYTYARN